MKNREFEEEKERGIPKDTPLLFHDATRWLRIIIVQQLTDQCTAFGGYEGVRQGPVHFAGEHCSVKFQGFMEGGAREGAREIIRDYRLG